MSSIIIDDDTSVFLPSACDPAITTDTTTSTLKECQNCGAFVSDTFETDDSTVCLTCAENYYQQCVHCDSYVSETYTTDRDDRICQRCADRHYWSCDDCGTFSRCLTAVAGGDSVCENCTQDYWDCDGCGELIASGTYCGDCEDNNCYSSYIFDYYYKPIPEFHGDGPLFLGTEIELSVIGGDLDGCAELATSYLGDLAYLKEDSSIGYGFEIVTHPMAYSWAMAHFPWELFAKLRDAGCETNGNTGIHVHVNRATFTSAAHAFRWMKFIYRNASDVITIARRESTSWARFDDNDRHNVKEFAKGAKGDRYCAINTRNDDTFELRVFASSLEPREIQAALGLAAASVEYTKNLSVSDIVRDSGWEWSAFLRWLDDRPEYAPLRQEAEVRSCAS